MNERLSRPDPLKQVEEIVKESLRDIGRRSRNPDFIDRIALPADRWLVGKLARMFDISPEEIAELQDS